MLDPEFTIRDDFPPVDHRQWQTLVEDALNGALKDASFEEKSIQTTYEGIHLQSVYSRHDWSNEGDATDCPLVHCTRPSASVSTDWDLRQEHSLAQPKKANEAILADLKGGVSSLLLIIDRAAQEGFDPDDPRAKDLVGHEGLMAYHIDDLDLALADVQLSMIGVCLEPGAAFLPAAAMLIALWKRRQLLPEEVQGAFNADPIGVLARKGRLPFSLETGLMQLSDLAAWTSEHYPRVRTIGVDTAPYHHAGASATQDLALAMATGVQYLRSMTDAGTDIDSAAQQILFRMSLDTHHFLSIAKLRAARRLWERVVEACGGSSDSAVMRVHARTSNRVLTRYDPTINLLRNTVGIFAAGIGGAEAITSVPFDFASGQTSNFSRRLARNTALVLQEESHLHHVIDPAGGSWFLETLTDQIAEKSWEVFQQIERQGGIIRALESGWVAKQIESVSDVREADIATRKRALTGISEFPHLEEQPVTPAQPNQQELRESAARKIAALRNKCDSHSLSRLLPEQPNAATLSIKRAIEAAYEGATLGQLAAALGFHQETVSIVELKTSRLAAPFEELRDASLAWKVIHGHRPRVFLANLGSAAEFASRAAFSKGFFEAGGFEVISSQGFQDAAVAAKAFAESKSKIVVICSSDKLYSKLVPVLAQKLKADGARSIVLAGQPGPHESDWRTAGVDRFIFTSCNALETLRELLAEEGVLPT